MAIDMFLKVEGVTGESKDSNHTGWTDITSFSWGASGNDSNLLIVFYVQIMPDDFVMQLHRF